ncbi:hypothetical protein KSP40_PGU018726 [Platanthera guangdongensis]|uniref:Uncharacterized protein n=1 Tax=Platanthera guangdongensis TaxID=2320717 RepID=A0ABR2MI09_9ASPA
MEAASLAVGEKHMEIVYYPNVGMPEFFVKAGIVEAGLKFSWFASLKIKMPIWAEEISGTKWFTGTFSFVEYADT